MTKEKSLKINSIVGIINTIINILFPLIIYMYISRVLQPEGVGVTQLASSVSSYFDLFATLGIPLYAVRHISMLRENKEEQDRNAIEIFWINIINALVMFLAYLLFIFILYGIGNSFYIFLIYGFTIFSSAFGVEWYFKANEEFIYITIRNLIVKIISTVLIFYLVKDSSHIIYYTIIQIGGVLGYSFINFIKFTKNVKFKFIKINYLKHLKPALSVFLMSLSTVIYCSLDTVMLGYIQSEYSVGIYTAAYRVTTTIIAVTTAINTIMLPRLSYYYKNNETEKIRQILSVCFQLTLMISIPAVIGIEIFAEEIILLLSGPDFMTSVAPLRIMATIVLFVTLTNLIGIQVFYSSGNVKKTIISVLGGAIINLIFNFILIPIIDCEGAAVGTLIAEFVVLILQLIIGKELLIFDKFNKNIFKIIIASIIMTIVIIPIKMFISINYILLLLIGVATAVLIYFISLLLLKERYVQEGISKFSIRKKEKVNG